MTLKTKWKIVQRMCGLDDDGIPGSETVEKVAEELGISFKDANSVPADTNAALVDAYGMPGDENNLVDFQFPYPMHLYTRNGEMVSHTRVHKDCAKDLLSIFNELLETYGSEWIHKHGLDVYCGCFNFRKMRGGRKLSRHSWGIAIDLNCGENGNRTPWSKNKIGKYGYANMPIEVIRVFEKHGWKSAGAAWGHDAMHFQRTK